MTASANDTDELARFGYNRELDRSLGLFSSLAAGFSYISIMTGVFMTTRSSNCAGVRRPTTSSTRRR